MPSSWNRPAPSSAEQAATFRSLNSGSRRTSLRATVLSSHDTSQHWGTNADCVQRPEVAHSITDLMRGCKCLIALKIQPAVRVDVRSNANGWRETIKYK